MQDSSAEVFARMATKVDFYVLESATGLASRLHFVCRLTEKAYSLSTAVFAHTESAEVAGKLDEMLWTFRQGSFIPHEILTRNPPRAPVQIGAGAHEPESGELLINLCSQAPRFAQKFSRIAEIIDTDEITRKEGRERFRYYQEMGIEPETHRIS